MADELQRAAETTMQGAYADSTWRSRRMITKWWTAFKTEMARPTGVLFLAWLKSNGILDSSVLTYARTFLAVFPEWNDDEMKMFMRALARRGGLRPTTQATPLTQQIAQKVYNSLPMDAKMGFFLAWKTASRWADISRVTRNDIVPINNQECVIKFPDTKATALRPFRPDLFVHVVHPEGLTKLYGYLKKKKRLTTWNTNKIRQAIKMRTGPSYGAHSIKRGALQVLAQAAADGKISMTIVARLAKHAETLQQLPDQTVRYIASPVHVAMAQQTGQATRILQMRL